MPCDIVNETCDHNPKATIIGSTGQEIFQTSTKSFDKEIMETFVYMGFLPFPTFMLVLNLVSLCALIVRLLECEIIEKWMFSSKKRSRNLNIQENFFKRDPLNIYKSFSRLGIHDQKIISPCHPPLDH